MEHKRVTIDEVTAAYAFTGMAATNGSFCSIKNGWCGCPAVAVGLYRAQLRPGEAVLKDGVLAPMDDAFPGPYLQGFVGGVDGALPPSVLVYEKHEDNRLRQDGYEDGVAVHYHLWPNQPIPRP